MFPGTSRHNQLLRIVSTLGKPQNQNFSFQKSVIGKKVFNAVLNETCTFKKLRDVIPKRMLSIETHRLFLHLLSKLLVFDPIDRIECNEALKHPLLSSKNQFIELPYDPIPSMNDIDEASKDREMLKLLIHKEIRKLKFRQSFEKNRKQYQTDNLNNSNHSNNGRMSRSQSVTPDLEFGHNIQILVEPNIDEDINIMSEEDNGFEYTTSHYVSRSGSFIFFVCYTFH